MDYATCLRQLLQPLGVYDLRENTASGGELSALGQALDACCGEAERLHGERLAWLAEAEGLAQWESLFSFVPVGQTAAQRREAVCALLGVDEAGFTPAAMERSLAACGVCCRLAETGAQTLEVSFPSVYGRPEDFSRQQRVIEAMLPCHLAVAYRFVWVTWGQTREAGLTWGDLSRMTFGQWAVRDL